MGKKSIRVVEAEYGPERSKSWHVAEHETGRGLVRFLASEIPEESLARLFAGSFKLLASSRALLAVVEKDPRYDVSELRSVIEDLLGRSHLDVNQRAVLVGKIATGQDEDSLRSAASELGRRGGVKGGPARSEALTSEQRSSIARKAAKTRWQR